MAIIAGNINSANFIEPNTDGSLNIGSTVATAGEVAASASPAGRLVRALDVSPDFRLRTGQDALLWDDVFHHTVANSSKYAITVSTMTVALAAGFLQLNSGASGAAAAVARVQSWRTFPIQGAAPLYFDIWWELNATPVAGDVIEFGLGLATGIAAPADGVFFRLNGAGAFRGIVNYNGAETQNSTGGVFADPLPNTLYHALLAIFPDRVEFWQDDLLLGIVPKTGLAGFPCMSGALPVLLRQYNSAAATNPPIFKIARVTVTQGDLASNRSIGAALSGMGLSCVNALDGQAAGGTANAINSTAPVNATLSNTAAGYTTLGGKFQFAAVGGAETDYALFAFQAPPPSAALPGKNLIVTGVSIDTFNTGAAGAATLTLMEWALGLGSSAVSLATADSVATAARAPRRIGLGSQSLAASIPIGAQADRRIDVTFEEKQIVEAGLFLHIILRMPVGTATGAQVIRGNVTVRGYWD